MILVFDIGNTNVAAAIYSGGAGGRGGRSGEQLSHWKLRRPRRAGARWWKELVVLICAEAGTVPSGVGGCAISSVVPGDTPVLAGVLKRLTGAAPLVVKGSLPLGIRFAYRDPAALGPDRVCGMLAAVAKYGAPVIVADCGTAITVDAVARGKRHTGGMIAPGIAMSALALSKSTAALPSAGWSVPDGPAGRDTLAAIRAGTWYSAVGGVREGIAGLKKLTGKGATVIGTGGDAAVMQKETGMFDAVDPALVLEGAAIAWRIISRRRGGKR
jgi:type III pantothenate kinase